ncbi:MAG: 2-oxoacid:acceptor oxidoreductase subunit alpha [bacterium]|nr:2-oxoacid:acceptor oxidoreductase subunit alpha [bacterium]
MSDSIKFLWKISGEQGEGIDSTGHIFAYNAFKNGFHISSYRKYSSRIKGGNTTFEVLFSENEVHARSKNLNVLIALDEKAILISKEQINKDTFIIYDESTNIEGINDVEAIKIQLPLSKIAREITGNTLSRNMVALGASLAIFKNLNYEHIFKQIEKRFSKKSMNVVENNKKAFLEGYNLVKNYINQNNLKEIIIPSISNNKRMSLLTGNEALTLGMLYAGVKYFSGYPITPASSILEMMIKNIKDFGGVAIQTEDEISAINSAIGASIAGVRAATATSGPGFSLMVEAIGYAYMTETPIVIIDVQRGGPSTGLPTKTEDSDILNVVFCGHGDIEKIVLFPSNPYEMFVYANVAFNLAEKYQLPVIVLSDLNLAENVYTTNYINLEQIDIKINRGKYVNNDTKEQYLANFNGELNRYSITDDGISYRIIPGTAGFSYQISGNEHDEEGFITENKEVRHNMMLKRKRKLQNFNEYYVDHIDIGLNPKVAFIAYGFNFYYLLDVLKELHNKTNVPVRLIKVITIYPFPIEKIEKLIDNMEKVVFFEQNMLGQLRRLYYMFNGTKSSLLINKFDGEPFYFEDLYEQVYKLIFTNVKI